MAIRDQDIARESQSIEVNPALHACPMDFSKYSSVNPRVNTVQKEYKGKDHSNFNQRAQYAKKLAPAFSNSFGSQPGQIPVEPRRYRLVWTKQCPWATRTSIAISLLGLDNVISKGLVDPLRPAGVVGDWFFTLDPGEVDPVLKTHSLGESYRKADPNYADRVTVPAIVDIKTGKVVNNNYHDLIIELATAWKAYHAPDAPDLYPEELRDDIDALDALLYADLITAIGEAADAESQEEYEQYYDQVFHCLDWLEERLGKHRYLLGNHITDPDLRFYVVLIWFDIVDYQKFYLNKKRLIDYPNLWNYAKDLYSIPAFKKNTGFEDIKKRVYYLDHTPFKDFPRLIPKGPDLSIWEEPNDRLRFEHSK